MKNFVSCMIFSLTLLASVSAYAQVKDKKFKDWTVYTTTLQGKKTCYMAGFPKSKTGNYKKRDEPYFLVTKINNDVFEVSESSGYKYKDNSDVELNIDGNKYKMFTKGELAWASNSDKDMEIIQAMKKGNTLTARGTSIIGTYSIDKYSLSGFTDAFERINSLCNG